MQAVGDRVALRFHARVGGRTGGRDRPGEARSETTMCGLNPELLQRMAGAAAWPRVEPGSLNLRTSSCAVARVGRLEPVLTAFPHHVRGYPRSVLRQRKGWNFWCGTVSARGRSAPVLIRRARENPLPGLLEAYAAVHLRAALQLTNCQMVEVEVFAGPRLGPPAALARP